MSYRKEDNIEMDELNIKSHLNTSLELNGIRVTEDLIQRTLKAVNQQRECEVEPTTLPRKNFRWDRYVRGIAGVAAAILVVMLGYSVAKDVPMGAKKDAAPNENFMAAEKSTDSVAPEQAEPEMGSLSQEEPDMIEEAAITDDTADTKYSINATEKMNDEQVYGTTDGTTDAGRNLASDYNTSEEEQGALRNDFDGQQELNFQDISILTPEQLKEVTITNKAKGLTITLTDYEQIQDFYTKMGNYTFIVASDASTDRYYSVELDSSTQEESFYTILIGENITVRYQKGADIVETIYDSTDYENFILELDLFFEEIYNN